MGRKLVTEQLAEKWGIQPHTLCNWRWRGIGPPYQTLNGAVRYDEDEAEAWAAEQTRTSTANK